MDLLRHGHQDIRHGRKAARTFETTPRNRICDGNHFISWTTPGLPRESTEIGKATGLFEGMKSAVGTLARELSSVLHEFGTASAQADFFGTERLPLLKERG